jgi:thiosulfate reductase cytochrome b subunit
MRKVYLYPLWIRIWHLLNAILCLVLIITGVSMQYSNPDYPLIRFDIAVSLHNICGISLSALYFFFVAANIFSSNGKYYREWIYDLRYNFNKQLKYYINGIFKKEHKPFTINENRKFNPLQKISYVLIMYFFLPVIIISGWILLFPEVIPNLQGVSGIYITDLFHIISGFIVSVFMFVHIYFCTIGTTTFSNFRSMISGWHN